MIGGSLSTSKYHGSARNVYVLIYSLRVTALASTIHQIEEQYETSLRNYLLRGDEESLFQAYELSRQAIAAGLGVMAILENHRNALMSLLRGLPADVDSETVIDHSYDFLREVVSPFEMLRLGFFEASATVEGLTRSLTLERKALDNAIRARQAEESLRTAEEKYRFLVEGTQAFLLRVDRRGVITYANDATCRMLGFSPGELPGKSCLRFVFPEDRSMVIEHFAQQIFLKRERTYTEFRYSGRSGQQGWVSFFVNPILDRDRVVGLTGIGQEITRRKLGEEALLWYAAIVESSDDAIVGKTLGGIITSWNKGAERIFGYRPDEAIGKSIELIIPPSLANEERDILDHISRGERVPPFETIRIRKDGTPIQISATISPIKDARGAVIGASKIARDVTERKKMEFELKQLHLKAQKLNAELEERVRTRTLQLQEANEELEAFSYSVAHDLRAPVRAIDGFTRVLQEDYSSGLTEEGKRYLSITRANTKRMGQLIDDLLALSRVGRKELEAFSVVPIGDIAQEVAEELQKRDPGPQIAIRLGELPPVLGSAPMIRQVLVNLISNALKFTRGRPDPTIAIEGKAQEHEVIFSVRDNGIGFDMRYVKKLFGVFQRLHSADKYEGTGVGLAIVQRIIHRHGGRVWAEAEVNKGATFYFTLPRKEDPS